MVRRYCFLLLLLSVACGANAQTVKTDVLVIDGGSSGIGAAVQAARSGVKTLIVEASPALGTGFTATDMDLKDKDTALVSDTWNVIYSKYQHQTKGVYNLGALARLFKETTDTVKNLSVMTETKFLSIAKSGKGWEIKVSNKGVNVTIKAKVVIDATPQNSVALMAGALSSTGKEGVITVVRRMPVTASYYFGTELFRTSIAIGGLSEPLPHFIPMGTLIPQGVDNMVLAGGNAITGETKIAAMGIGQAAGAIAAYAAFFKTQVSMPNVGKTQAELLSFKAVLMPFNDVKRGDIHWKAIQQVGTSGILRGIVSAGGLAFMPDAAVEAGELRANLKPYFFKAQIWFEDHTVKELSIKDALSLLAVLATKDAPSLTKDVEKKWLSSYQFTTKFEQERNISRREFAVLVADYLNPFSTRVDIGGNVQH